MRISDWSSDVCSSDLVLVGVEHVGIVVALSAQRCFLGGVFGLLAQQRVTIRLGDLVIIGMDFAERQESVAVATVIDERRLERRLDACHLGEIDIAFELDRKSTRLNYSH